MRSRRAVTSPEYSDLWTDWGGKGPLLHFAHANGFPPGTYRLLIEALRRDFHVVTSCARPLWGSRDPDDLHDWRELAADLAQTLDARGLRGAVGVGHSLGAAMTFLAAAEDPGLFSAFVAVDPLLLGGVVSVIWKASKMLGLAHRLPLVRGARARLQRWPNLEAARRAYRSKAMFATWRPEVIDDYLRAGFIETAGESFDLRYPRAWEARVFEVAPANVWPALQSITTPGLFVRGENSDTFLRRSATRLKTVNSALEVTTMPGATHFIPMEQPTRLARVVTAFLHDIA